MSCAKIDPALHQAQKPPWIKVRLPSNPVFFSTKALISDLRLHTVCESAQCPNRWECWSQGTATMMIAGERCTRACGFCAVSTAKPFALEEDEPQRVAEAVRRMKLKHVVITAVARDDLKDGGAESFRAHHRRDPRDGSVDHHRSAGARFSRAGLVHPDRARRRARHFQSQHGNGGAADAGRSARARNTGPRSSVLRRAKELSPKVVTKSGVMLGLGETEPELFQTMDDLREVGCQVLTLGQYLRPTPNHLPVVEYITPEQFDLYGEIARAERIRARRLRPARAQLVSRGRFSSGRPLDDGARSPRPRQRGRIDNGRRRSSRPITRRSTSATWSSADARKLDHVLVVDDGSSDATADTRARSRRGGHRAPAESSAKAKRSRPGLRHWLRARRSSSCRDPRCRRPASARGNRPLPRRRDRDRRRSSSSAPG